MTRHGGDLRGGNARWVRVRVRVRVRERKRGGEPAAFRIVALPELGGAVEFQG